MSAIRPLSLFAMVTLLGTLAACASSPAPHTSDPPAASTGDTKGDAANGKALFMSSCTTCHGVTQESNSTMVGPSLFGVVGRKAGTVKSLLGPSEKLKTYGVTWSTETLDEFLANPLAKLPFDTAMLGRLPDAKQRADVVAYLATLKP